MLGFAIVSISVGTGDTDQIEITGAQSVQSMLGGSSRTTPGSARRRSGDRPGLQRHAVRPVLGLEPGGDRAADPGPVRDGDLKMIFHHFPMTQSGFFLGAFGAVAAAKQDYEWQFIQLFFAQPGEGRGAGG